MRVPRPQVQEQALPGIRSGASQPITANPALGQMANAVVGSIFQAREEVNQIKYADAMNQVMAVDEGLTNEYSQLKGDEFLKNDPKMWTESRKKKVNAIAAGLPPEVAARFRVATGRAGVAFQSGINSHVIKQTEFKKETNLNSSLEALHNYAISHPKDQAGIDARTGLALSNADAVYSRLDPQARSQAIRSLRGGALIAQSQGLAQVDVKAAKEFVDKNREAMSAHAGYAQFNAKFQGLVDASSVEDKANELDSMGLSLEGGYKKIGEWFKDDPAKMKDLRQEWEHRFQMRKTSQAAATQEAEGKIWGAVFPVDGKGMSINSSKKQLAGVWASLDGESAAKLHAQLETYGKRNAGGDGSDDLAKYATFLKFVDDPKTLANLTDSQIMAYRGTLGPNLTKHLLDAKRQAGGDLAKLEKATLNDLPFKDIASEYGLKTKGKVTQEQQATLGLLRSKTIDAIREEQSASGRQVTPERKEEILRQQLTTIKKGGWFAKDKLLFEANNFMDLDATDKEKTQALEVLTRNGVQATPGNVLAIVQEIRKGKK